jgi:hypothetical protein
MGATFRRPVYVVDNQVGGAKKADAAKSPLDAG